MASISTFRNGHCCIQFVAGDETRKTIRLGKCDRKTAESIARHVEALLAAKLTGQPCRAKPPSGSPGSEPSSATGWRPWG
jgi:hypothetical protein